jgi:hypothetical protein
MFTERFGRKPRFFIASIIARPTRRRLIAPADIARRFPRSLRNLLDVYAGAVDHARCFLNSGPFPDIVFVQDGDKRTILNQTIYDQLVKEANL